MRAKRYHINFFTIERHEDGDWVKYKDYKYLEDEYNRLLDSIKRISEYYKNE